MVLFIDLYLLKKKRRNECFTKLECLLELVGKVFQVFLHSNLRKLVKYGQKRFITLGTGTNVIKLFMDVIHECLY